MSLGRPFARAMGMDDATWLRHANPWSGWSRVATTPVLFLALWSHVWLGWWALVPIGLVVLWLWLNPRLFPPPRDTRSWMTRGVLGERLWVEGTGPAIPRHHRTAARWILSGQAAFTLAGVWGVVVQDFSAAFLGWHAGAAMKLWFVDRMVRLYDERQRGGPGETTPGARADPSP